MVKGKVFAFLGISYPAGGRGGGERPAGVSHVPNLNGWSSKLTCYPRVVGPAHDAVCNLEEQRGRSERHHLQNGCSKPRAANVRAPLRRSFRVSAGGK